MWEYGFFNSVNGDRIYNADAMNNMFEGLITDGVFLSVGDKMAVQASGGMTVQIATGRGRFGGRWVKNTTPYTMTLDASDVTLNRYCAVCVRVDATDNTRSAVPYLKYSEYATNPVKPTMEDTAWVKEKCLAYVYIGAGVNEITQADIEDTRANEKLCGWVTGLIDQVSSATLFAQFQAIFEEWFGNLKDLIDENTEVMLVNAMPVSLVVTLPADGWVDGTQTVEVVGMNATKTVQVMAHDDSLSAYASAGIKCTAQGTNTLTFTADTTPSVDIKANVLHMGA